MFISENIECVVELFDKAVAEEIKKHICPQSKSSIAPCRLKIAYSLKIEHDTTDTRLFQTMFHMQASSFSTASSLFF